MTSELSAAGSASTNPAFWVCSTASFDALSGPDKPANKEVSLVGQDAAPKLFAFAFDGPLLALYQPSAQIPAREPPAMLVFR